MTSTLPPLIQAFSGAVGSAAANTLSYPLDLVSTRLQTTSSRKLRGLYPRIASQEDRSQSMFLRIPGNTTHPKARFGNRGLAWSLRWSNYRHDCNLTLEVSQCAVHLQVTMRLTYILSFLYFYFYSFLRTFITRRRIGASPGVKVAKPILLSMPEEIGIGFLAGVASRAISTPLSVVTVRLQTASENEEEEKPDEEKGDGVTRPVASPIQVLRDINTEEGLRGLWRGWCCCGSSTTLTYSQRRVFHGHSPLLQSCDHDVTLPNISTYHGSA